MSKHPIPDWLRSQFSRIEDEVRTLGPCGVFTQMRTVTQTYFEQAAAAPRPPALGGEPVPEYFQEACDKFDWAPEEALRFYAEGKHFDTDNGRTRILCTGAIASHALKAIPGQYAEMKGFEAALGGEPESKLIKLAAELASRRPIRSLQDLCDRQKSVSTAKLIEDVEMCGDFLAAIAVDIRHCVEASRARLAPLQAEIERLNMVTNQQKHAIQSLRDQLVESYSIDAGSGCCTPTDEERALLAAGDCTPEELWGGPHPTCPKCIKAVEGRQS
ncbi:hypothetical protein V2J83_24780 [Pseudomonas alliivorans]|nr:hypothetical protein [Pseudomonas alliivorans]